MYAWGWAWYQQSLLHGSPVTSRHIMPSCSRVHTPGTFQPAIGTVNRTKTASRSGSGADGCSCRSPRLAERQEAWLTAPRQRRYLSILRLSMEMRHSHHAQRSRSWHSAICHYQSSDRCYWTSLLERRRACLLQPFDPKMRRCLAGRYRFGSAHWPC